MSCLGDATVVGLAEGTLTAEARDRALSHLEGCATCALLAAQATRLSSKERRVLDRYLVHGELGAGGMGRVVRAFDPRLGRDVALKVLLATDHAGGAKRLLREARALALLNHPNIVRVYDVHRHEDEVFVAMELIEGPTLRTWLDDKPSQAAVLATFSAAGRGLHAAHEAGLAHRDFKPANVMIDDDGGRVVVVDFGLAAADPAESGSTSAAALRRASLEATTARAVGTPRYMAPEQWNGVADSRADQYQFCLALLEALAGRWPLPGTSLAALATAKSEGSFVAGAFDRVPRRLRPLLRRGLDPDPERRHPNLLTVVHAIESAPTRRRVAAGVLVAGAAAGAVAYAVAPGPTNACDDPHQLLAGAWDPGRAEAVHSAFAATAVPFAEEAARTVEARLDTYAEAWATNYALACSRRSANPRLHDTTMRCLDRGRTELGALVDALARGAGPSDVARAGSAVLGLTPVEHCGDEQWLDEHAIAPADPRTAAVAESLQAELSRARAQVLAGQFAPARVQLESLVARARALEHEVVVVRALALYTQCLRHFESPETIPIGEEAYLAARLVGDDLTAWMVASDVATIHRRLGDYPGAERWLESNEAVVQRLGDPVQEAAFHSAFGVLHLERGDVLAALESNGKAVELIEVAAPQSRYHAVYLRRLGSTYRARRRFEDSRRALEEARQMLVSLEGEHDPEVRLTDFDLGMLAMYQQDYAGAIGPYEKALEATTVLLGNSSSASVECRGALSAAYSGAGRPADAERLLHEAVALVEGGVHVSPRARSLMHRDLGRLLAKRERWKDAAARYKDAREVAVAMHESHARTTILSSLDELIAALPAGTVPQDETSVAGDP